MGMNNRTQRILKINELPGIGSKRAAMLIKYGYGSIDKIKKADIYELKEIPLIGFNTAYRIKKYLGQGINYRDMEQVNESTLDGPIEIENKKIRPWQSIKDVNKFKLQPDTFELERTTVWSFPERGDWATHTPQYRGNWSPKVARNIILRYSQEGDTVLDPMVGSGTTLVECLLTGRNSIGIDINRNAAILAKNNLDIPDKYLKDLPKTRHQVFVGDVRNMNLIKDNEIDLIATHPPYANIIKYGPTEKDDLSAISSYEIFIEEMKKAASEMYRVLKPGGYCAILMGDTHNKTHYVPIAFRTMLVFLEKGFILKEDIIKHEWNCWSDPKWRKYSTDKFLLTMHEHLFIFWKPEENENIGDWKNSSLEFFRKELSV